MVRFENSDTLMTAYLSGEIDHHSARDMREEIDANIEQNKPTTLALDFKDVSFMDSSGIGLVMGRYKILKSMDGVVKIVNSSSYIKKVMRLAGLDKLAELQ